MQTNLKVLPNCISTLAMRSCKCSRTALQKRHSYPVLHHCWLLGFYILATSKVISGWVLTVVAVHTHGDLVTAPLGDQATSTMTWYLTQSHYPDIVPTSACPILLIMSAWLEGDMHWFLRQWFDSTRVQISRAAKMGDKCSSQLIRPLGVVYFRDSMKSLSVTVISRICISFIGIYIYIYRWDIYIYKMYCIHV